MNNEDRWKQRFQNFENAYAVFQRRMDEYQENPTKEAYQMSLVQGFEIIIELGWKVLKDYLEDKGYDDVKNGKQAIRQAFQDELIREPEVWMQGLEIRNETSHTYNPAIMKKVTHFIADDFYPVVRDLYFEMKKAL